MIHGRRTADGSGSRRTTTRRSVSTRRPRPRRSPRRTASSPANCTPTPTPATPRPRSGSRRSPPPTTWSATRRSAQELRRGAADGSDGRRARVRAGPGGAEGFNVGFDDIGDLLGGLFGRGGHGGRGGNQQQSRAQPGSRSRGRPHPRLRRRREGPRDHDHPHQRGDLPHLFGKRLEAGVVARDLQGLQRQGCAGRESGSLLVQSPLCAMRWTGIGHHRSVHDLPRASASRFGLAM